MTKKSLNIIVTGSAGQLGQSFGHLIPSYPEFNIILLPREKLDISNEAALREILLMHKPSAIINCAAYTNVEAAEDNIETAMLYNTKAVSLLGKLCTELEIPLVHFSTDYVFDGKKKSPYNENDACNPLSIYGKSKLNGEIALTELNAHHYTFRVSWLYSTYGHNFYKTILRRAKEVGRLRVVNDQIASPTYAGHLAKDILLFLHLLLIEKRDFPFGVYHYEQTGEASWFDFAKKIMQLHKMNIPVEAVSTSAFPMKAERPAYSKMSGTHFFKTTGIEPKSWEDGLKDCVTFDLKN